MRGSKEKKDKAWAQGMVAFGYTWFRDFMSPDTHPTQHALLKLWESIDKDDSINHKKYPVFVNKNSGCCVRKLPYKNGSFIWLEWSHDITIQTTEHMELVYSTRDCRNNDWIAVD